MARTCFLVLAALLFAVPAVSGQDQPARPQPIKNLIRNASFEAALTPDGLPGEWAMWVQPGGTYRSKLIAEGRTGKKCLRIDGEGIRAVIFTNLIDIDRRQRYALRGWVKFEGDIDARATIVFNYMHDGKRLGLHDNMGVIAKQKGWQLLTKTDRAALVPDASVIQVSCNLDGKGTAWFEGLELIAFDHETLPADFEVRYGPAEFAVLARRIGTWNTETTIKPGVWVPDGAKSKGVESIDWALGKKFIQGKHKRQPGNVESMFMETFDAQSGVFRSWYFDSEGNHPRSESTGAWDEKAKTLTYKSTDPNDVTSVVTLRFVSADQLDWHGVWRDKKGDIQMEMEGKLMRRK